MGTPLQSWDHSVIYHSTQVNVPRFNPSQADQYSTYYCGGMEGWVDIDGWLYTKMVCQSADSHQSRQ